MISGMESVFRIEGGVPLRGSVSIRGSKNAASKLMVASLLSDAPSVIGNVPQSLEIGITRELCEVVGSRVELQGGECRIETKEIRTSLVPELSRRNRIPILAVGPLLHRSGVAEVPVPGGDAIGHRPIDFHIAALEAMGVVFERRPNSYYAEAKRIRGADIEFPHPSVGATENVILTAVLAEGKTTIQNAAVEPEIMNLVEMLHGMGAKIFAEPAKRFFEIHGVSSLSGANISVIPDRNEIISFISAALATRGDILIENMDETLVESFLAELKKFGAECERHERGMKFFPAGEYHGCAIETSPHPGFMTDWQQPFVVALTQARGESVIHETVYDDRFGYCKDLKRMGADISVSDDCNGFPPCRFFAKGFAHIARIQGPRKLHGAHLVIKDIRAGIAHVIAALAADGESMIQGVHHLDRGYEHIDERLVSLGARIRRIDE